MVYNNRSKARMEYCKIHTEKPAAGKCADCGGSFCEECLDRSGRCGSCSAAAERFLDGFSMALSRWEAGLHNPQINPEAAQPIHKGKRAVFSRAVLVIFLVVVGVIAIYFLNNYNIYLGQMFLEQGNFTKALHYYQKASAKEPQNSGLKLILGNIYYQQGVFDQAVSYYSQAIELDSLNAAALNNLAWTYAQMETNLDQALILSKRSLEIEPDNPAYLDTLAEIYFLKKEYYRALTYIRKALDQNPPDIEYFKKKLEKIKKMVYSQKLPLEV